MTGFPESVRTILKVRASNCRGFGTAGPVCEVMALCQGAHATEAHHRRNRGMGGSGRSDTNLAANGLMVCSADHRWITEHPERARELGWLVPQHKTPSEVPVMYRGKWALLSDSGGVVFIPAPDRKPA